MVWGLDMQRQDALLINLAGRQRMLLQQTARLALDAGVGETGSNQEIQDSAQLFAATLEAMLHGGYVQYMPGENVWLTETHVPGIRSTLEQLSIDWIEYKALLDAIQLTPRNGPRHVELAGLIKGQVSRLEANAHTVVDLMEKGTAARLRRLRMMQFGFLAAALALLAAGAMLTRASVLRPLYELSRATERLKENDLNTRVDIQGPREIRALSRSFEAMRQNLQTARAELMALTAELEQRIKQRTRELDALHEVSHQITSRLDMNHVLHSVTDKVRTLLDGDAAMLCLLDESKEYLRLQAMSGKPLIPVYENYMSTINHASQALTSPNAVLCRGDACAGGCGLFTKAHAASHLVAPLRIGDNVIGAVCVGSAKPRHFPPESAQLLTKLSNTAAIALQNAQLYTQAERVATLEERHRVAAEMHDGLGQMLSCIGLMTDQTTDLLAQGDELAAMEKIEQTREMVGKAIAEVRRAINSLISEPGSRPGLCSQIKQVVDEFSAETGRRVEWSADAEPGPECPVETVDQVLNVTREALKNAARHSGAEQIAVRLSASGSDYCLVIEDDGRGFDASRPGPSGHFGLQIMRARAAHIGGKAEILSAPGKGTRVQLTWPTEAV
jgi:two-component system nitrate/nitrite sensor histidine kinase NarX